MSTATAAQAAIPYFVPAAPAAPATPATPEVPVIPAPAAPPGTGHSPSSASVLSRGFNAELLHGDRPERIFAHHLLRLGIQRVLDIGSNEGQFALKLRRFGYAGRIYSVEPLAPTYLQLLANARHDPHWFPLALQPAGATDRLLRSDLLPQIEALKIDAPGHEDEAITSHLPLIDNVRLLMLRMSMVPACPGAADLFRLDERLVKELGFSRVSLEPSGYDEQGVAQRYDGIYFRPDRPARPHAGPTGLRVAAVVTSVGGTLERRQPDGSDLGPAWLQACMQSWRHFGSRVVSVAERAPPEGLEWARTQARPSIAQMLAAVPVPHGSHLLLTNADIVLMDPLRDLIGTLEPDAVYYGNRIDVEREGGASGGLAVRGVYPLGFDYFLLPAAFIRVLIDEQLLPEQLRIGEPWWDYTLPLLAVARGFAMKKLSSASPLALHYLHATRYSLDLWHRNRQLFIGLTARLLQGPDCYAAGFLGQILQHPGIIPDLICRSLP